MPSTQVLQGETPIRLTLKNALFYGLNLNPTAARDAAYDRLSAWSSAYPVAQPTSVSDQGTFVLDAKIKGGASVLVADLVQQIEAAGYVTVVDLSAVDVTAQADPAARQAAADDAAKTAAASGLFAQLTAFFVKARAIVIIAIVAGVVFYAWPWLKPLLAGFRQRKAATA